MKYKFDWKTKVAYYQYSWFVCLNSILSFLMFIATVIVAIVLNDNLTYTILKGITSLLFVVASSYSLFKLNKFIKWKHFIMWAFTFLCFISDIVININFVAGMATFFIAHCVFIWFCTYIYKIRSLKILWLLITYIPILLLVNLLFGLKAFNQSSLIWIFTNFYAIALFTSFLYTVVIFYKNQNSITLSLMLALILFVVSDFLLMFDQFLDKSYLTNSANNCLTFFVLSTYYLSMNLNAINLKNIKLR